jgi:hypothetical protein
MTCYVRLGYIGSLQEVTGKLGIQFRFMPDVSQVHAPKELQMLVLWCIMWFSGYLRGTEQ